MILRTGKTNNISTSNNRFALAGPKAQVQTRPKPVSNSSKVLHGTPKQTTAPNTYGYPASQEQELRSIGCPNESAKDSCKDLQSRKKMNDLGFFSSTKSRGKTGQVANLLGIRTLQMILKWERFISSKIVKTTKSILNSLIIDNYCW